MGDFWGTKAAKERDRARQDEKRKRRAAAARGGRRYHDCGGVPNCGCLDPYPTRGFLEWLTAPDDRP